MKRLPLNICVVITTTQIVFLLFKYLPSRGETWFLCALATTSSRCSVEPSQSQLYCAARGEVAWFVVLLGVSSRPSFGPWSMLGIAYPRASGFFHCHRAYLLKMLDSILVN